MMITQKCQYALRAVFELSRRESEGPVRIAEIAENQAIPVRFLENILNELKHAGFVKSIRGKAGGYLLEQPAGLLTVGKIMRFAQGPILSVGCTDKTDNPCPLQSRCNFLPMWERAAKALSDVYDTTTFADLLNEAGESGQPQPLMCPLDWTI